MEPFLLVGGLGLLLYWLSGSKSAPVNPGTPTTKDDGGSTAVKPDAQAKSDHDDGYKYGYAHGLACEDDVNVVIYNAPSSDYDYVSGLNEGWHDGYSACLAKKASSGAASESEAGRTAGKSDAVQTMADISASAYSCGYASQPKWNASASKTWQQAYREGFGAIMSDNGWTQDEDGQFCEP
jgi:hypothetical protein